MDLKLSGKTYIVTGGAKGIGEAISKELAQEGANVVVAGRSEAEGEKLVRWIESIGAKGLNILVELSKEGACKDVIEQTVARFGTIDGIVNNAGFNDGAGLEKGSPEKFRASVNTNLMHYYDMVYYALPYLKQTKGSIVNISSKTCVTGQGGTSGYAASKGAQLALTREWAVELAPYGIRVNAILPAEVMTPLYEKWVKTLDNPEARLKEITARIPLGHRMTTSEEIAAMAVFLLSERSAHTTGQWMFVDGGYVHLDRAMLSE
ncbi:MAG: SDR family oxidoreductase [Bacteroidota bacterium]